MIRERALAEYRWEALDEHFIATPQDPETTKSSRHYQQSPDGAASPYDRSSSSAFAALRSAVAKPSVNRS